MNISLSMIIIFLMISGIELYLRIHYSGLLAQILTGKMTGYPNAVESLGKLSQGYPLTPNTTVVYTGYLTFLQPSTITTNSQGFRDVEHNKGKPANTVRILSLGDSVAFGEGVNLEDTYAKVLERKLNNHSTKKYEVLNFGRFAYGTMDELELLEKKGLDYSPDIVILMMVYNDFQNVGTVQNDNLLLESVRRDTANSSLRLSQWLDRKLTILEYRKSENMYNETDKYNLVKLPLEGIINLCLQHDIHLMVLQYHGHQPYMDDISNFLATQGIRTIDLQKSKLVTDYRNGEIMLPDGHPTPLGHQIIADILFENLIEEKILK
ncbi:MAG: SGNH/GDSL hydrolase family protein [Candidatus Woesearchaeota archaeon]